MKTANLLHVTERAAWRAWLAEHHDTATEVWLVFLKVHTRGSRVSYEDAVEEALCFGWIDSIVRRLDAERYARKFTPRKTDSNWSPSNRRRLAKVIREGRMTPAGLSKVPRRGQREPSVDAAKVEPALSRDLGRELRANPAAWATFKGLAPSYRRNYVGWVMSAKQQTTRLRRLREAIRLLARGEKLGMK